MNQISWFRGMAGEVVHEFMRPRLLLNALPVAVGILLFARIADHVGTAGQWVFGILFYLCYTMLVGRFALTASDGKAEPSSEIADIALYAVRNLLLTLSWFLPLRGVVWLMVGGRSLFSLYLTAGPIQMFRTGFTGPALTGLFFFSIILVSLGLVMTARFSGVSPLFSREGWQWLILERRADLAPFVASLIGGIAIFIMLYSIPLGFVAIIAMKISHKSGGLVSSFLFFLPVAALPRLIGQLCGVFVASEKIADVTREGGSLYRPEIVAVPTTREILTPDMLLAKRAIREPKPDVDEIVTQLEGLDGEHMAPALALAEEALAADDRPLRQTIVLALLAKQTGDVVRAVKLATDAIEQSMQRRFSDVGLEVFEAFRQERQALRLSAGTLEIFGNILMKRKAFLDAAWCYHTGAVVAGDTLKAQKKILNVAEATEKEGQERETLALYEFFIKSYPDSTLIEFAREGRERLKSRGE